MPANDLVVRIINPSVKSRHPSKTHHSTAWLRKQRARFLQKIANTLIGSVIGIISGVAIYLMLKITGVHFGGFESSLIIGLPSALGILASFAIF